jgi:flagellar basal-body rod modification protein FlgD
MMTPVTPTAQTGTNAGPDTARKTLSSDLDTFLRLLTAQIRNQDPLEPADGTAYAAQLAQFSTVEQAVRSNELLSAIGDRLGVGSQEAIAWIGREVRHDGPVTLDGSKEDLVLDIPSGADRAELVAHDADGAEAMRRPIDPRSETMTWDGEDGEGGVLPQGAYALTVESWAGAQALGVGTVSRYSLVREVALSGDGPSLILEDGTRVDPATALSIRTPT